jgi:pimeloyl-ACP methyl ester carboxylesterase
MLLKSAALLCLSALAMTEAIATEEFSPAGRTYTANDTLAKIKDSSLDATDCLKELVWPIDEFEVKVLADDTSEADFVVRFPSPVTTGNAINDLVALEWYVPKDEHGKPLTTPAPAVIVVHESGSGMTVGRLFAAGLRNLGLHTFMVQLPNYGLRKGKEKPTHAQFLTSMKQGIADVRRSRDAVSVLPGVNGKNVSVQGTSLGGFVASNSAALDDGFSNVFLLLSGGNLYELIQNGRKEAAKVRQRLKEEGLSGDELKQVLWKVEPTRIAHRLNKDRTWLYSGTFDTVVPLSHGVAFANAAKLPSSHHIRLPANHYTGIVFMPFILHQIKNRVAE